MPILLGPPRYGNQIHMSGFAGACRPIKFPYFQFEPIIAAHQCNPVRWPITAQGTRKLLEILVLLGKNSGRWVPLERPDVLLGKKKKKPNPPHWKDRPLGLASHGGAPRWCFGSPRLLFGLWCTVFFAVDAGQSLLLLKCCISSSIRYADTLASCIFFFVSTPHSFSFVICLCWFWLVSVVVQACFFFFFFFSISVRLRTTTLRDSVAESKKFNFELFLPPWVLLFLLCGYFWCVLDCLFQWCFFFFSPQSTLSHCFFFWNTQTIAEGSVTTRTVALPPNCLKSVPPVPVRICLECWSLTPKNQGKRLARTCEKCCSILHVLCVGCKIIISIRNSMRHLKLCELYSKLCCEFDDVVGNEFQRACRKISRQYILDTKPASATKKKRLALFLLIVIKLYGLARNKWLGHMIIWSRTTQNKQLGYMIL